MTGSPRYHRSAGPIDWPATIKTFLLASAIAAVAGILYAFALHMIMFLYVRAFCTAIAGAAVGAAVAQQIKRSRIGSARIAVMISLASACVGLYFHWVFWIAQLTEWHLWAFAPDDFSRAICAINALGTWRHDGGNHAVAGPGLTMIWIFETLTILGCAIGFTLTMLKDALYCPHCLAWVKPAVESVLVKPLGDPDLLREGFEADDFAYLETMVAEEDAYEACSRISLVSCGKCDQLHLFNCVNIPRSIPGAHAENMKEVPVAHRLMISAATYEKLLAKIAELTAATQTVESADKSTAEATQIEPTEPAERDDSSN